MCALFLLFLRFTTFAQYIVHRHTHRQIQRYNSVPMSMPKCSCSVLTRIFVAFDNFIDEQWKATVIVRLWYLLTILYVVLLTHLYVCVAIDAACQKHVTEAQWHNHILDFVPYVSTSDAAEHSRKYVRKRMHSNSRMIWPSAMQNRSY